jgi:hypothetical protein
MARVFIGRDFENQIVGAEFQQNQIVGEDGDSALIEQLFGRGQRAAQRAMGVEVAGDEIVGSDFGDRSIVGADLQGNTSGQQLVYDQWLPLTIAAGLSVGIGATVDVELKPQRLFRPGCLMLSAVAQVLMVSGCTIGGENQFVASGAIPGEFFSPAATFNLLNAQTADRGTSIIISFTNTTAGAVILKGVWAGKSVVR